MTTTVKVTAHNFPTKVTISSNVSHEREYTGSDMSTRVRHGTWNTTEITLKDGQSWEGVVTDTQSIRVEELPR